MSTQPAPTIPTRSPKPKWAVDDTVTVGSTRWRIDSIHGGDVVLEASNVQPGIRWTTTLDRLPER